MSAFELLRAAPATPESRREQALRVGTRAGA